MAPGVDGRTLDALLNRGLIHEVPGHAFPRYALTSVGLLVLRILDARANNDDEEVNADADA